MHSKIVVLVNLIILICVFPTDAHARIDCKSEIIEPTEAALEPYGIHPWYADEQDVDKAMVSELTRTDYDVSLSEVKSTESYGVAVKEKQKRSPSGSIETEIILGLTDFIIDRAKAETVNWYMNDIQKNLCDGVDNKYSAYFYNTCVMQSQSKEALPYLPGLIQAFRKDLDLMPANLLCTKFHADKGYYLTFLTKGLIAGYPPENMLAGLAANDAIEKDCRADNVYDQQSTCDLYSAGVLARAYIKFVATKKVNDALAVLNDGFKNKLDTSKLSDSKKKQYLLEMVGLLRDMQAQIRRIKSAKKEGDQQDMISAAASQITEDLIEIVDNPLSRAIRGENNTTRNIIKPVINAINSIYAGQYSDAMLDINVIVSQFYDNRFDSVKDKIISIVASSQSLTFNTGEFADPGKIMSLCDGIYAKYFAEEKKKCASMADLNDLLSKDNLPERVLDKDYPKKIEGLLIIHYYLDRKPGGDSRKKSIQAVLNRLILEDSVSDLPKSQLCHANILAAFAALYNPDVELKNAQRVNAYKYLSKEERIEEIRKTLKMPEPVFLSAFRDSEQCRNLYDKLSQVISGSYGEKGLDIASSNDAFQMYLPTVASLATARSQEEVKNVLNDTVASVGSWRLKQKKDYTGSFGGMLGLNIGYENLNDSTSDGWATGLFAPVGFDFTSKKITPWLCPSGTCGLFVSILDLGAVANMRLNDNSKIASKDGNLRMSEVVSPGVYYHMNIKNTPVVFGAGWSFVPLLRTETVNNEKVDQGGSRALLFMTIDLPMYFM